jgi:hypothetical protein
MSVSQLNIFTFIKDIYQSLKHIDSNFNTVNEKIVNRLTKLEDNQQIIIDKLNNLEIQIQKIGEIGNHKAELDKNIEIELLKKVKLLNNITTENQKIELKPDELTFANIIENGYTFVDINDSIIGNNNTNLSEFDAVFNMDNNNYQNSNSNCNSNSNIESNIENRENRESNNNSSNSSISSSRETLESLYF